MNETAFPYDALLSHSTKDKAVVRTFSSGARRMILAQHERPIIEPIVAIHYREKDAPPQPE